MEKIYNEFKVHFDSEDKEKAVAYILGKLEQGEIDVVDLYTKVLTPMLNNIECDLEDRKICIWKEHVKTAIVRTIVECSYPYVIMKRDSLKRSPVGKAAVICPPDEYHDLGARMAADFFTIAGFDTIYVGGNTPYKDFYNAIEGIRPDVVAISVSNYYHLVAAKKMVDQLKEAVDYPVKIVVGGYAFTNDTENKIKTVGADVHAGSFEDILALYEGGVV